MSRCSPDLPQAMVQLQDGFLLLQLQYQNIREARAHDENGGPEIKSFLQEIPVQTNFSPALEAKASPVSHC